MSGIGGVSLQMSTSTFTKAPNTTLTTMVLFGLASYFVASVAYATFIFVQFNPLQILGLAASFFLLLVLLLWVFLRSAFKELSFAWGWIPIVGGLVLSAVLLFFSITWMHSSGPAWQEYFPTYPFNKLAQGLGFHQDSVFHLSLIQSILNFGYPSTGQNGVPFVPYHVLSHYVDAGLLAITGLQPFDSYSLLFFFKIVLQLSAITIFIWVTLRKQRTWLFALAWVFLTPVLVSDWINVGSHGLWFTSLLLILGAPYIFEVLKQKTPTKSQFWFLFLLVIMVGLGKVSSGLLLAVLLSVFLLFRDFRQKRTYLLISAWLVFFGIYWRLFNTGHSSGLQRPHVSGVLGFLNYQTTYTPGPQEPNLLGIYLLSGMLAISYLVFKNKMSLYLSLAGLASVFILAVVTQLLAGLAQPDIFYFIYGMYLPYVLLGFMSLVDDLSSYPVPGWSPININATIVKTSIVVLLCICVMPLKLSTLNPFAISPLNFKTALNDFNSGYFIIPNSSTGSAGASISSVFDGTRPASDFEQKTDMYTFRDSLYQILEVNGLNNKQVVLFAPKEVLSSSSMVQGGPEWAVGQLLYAVTGIPLIHGIIDSDIANFGQTSYDQDANAVSSRNMTDEVLCKFGKTVVVIRSVSPPVFELRCEAHK